VPYTPWQLMRSPFLMSSMSARGENRQRGGGVPVSVQALLAVRDPDTGTALPRGASAELWIDAPSRFVEYLDNPSATARAIDADGVFRTGDLAHLADVGFIYEARIGDAMRLGGFLVGPEEIEAVIQAQPRVAGVQVVSASRGGGDPVPVAFVRPCLGVERILSITAWVSSVPAASTARRIDPGLCHVGHLAHALSLAL
jgi:fatty-acyl-CoA synthase